jgi:S1-C subfamily serine protease
MHRGRDLCPRGLLPTMLGSYTMPVATSRNVNLTETVFTVGFPNIEMQRTNAKVTLGNVNSLIRAQDDPCFFQISAAVQPGNSGGPLVVTMLIKQPELTNKV